MGYGGGLLEGAVVFGPAIVFLMLAVMSITGFGANITLHMSSPHFRKIKEKHLQQIKLAKPSKAKDVRPHEKLADTEMAKPKANLWRLDLVARRWADLYSKDFYEEEVKQILKEAGIRLISRHEKSSSLFETGNPLDYTDGRKVFYVKRQDLETFEKEHPPEDDNAGPFMDHQVTRGGTPA